MPDLMIKCPKTGKYLSTGMTMDQTAFANAYFEGNSVGTCPHCGESHVWGSKDARLIVPAESK